jgi:hypothetical protein
MDFLCFFILFWNYLYGFISIWWVTKQIKSSDFPWAIYLAIFYNLLSIHVYRNKNWSTKSKKEMEQLRDFAENALENIEN